MEEGFQEGTAVYIQLLLDETYYNQIMYMYTMATCSPVPIDTPH